MGPVHDKATELKNTHPVRKDARVSAAVRVRILGIATLQPGEVFDLFIAADPTELSEDTILRGLEKPWGDLYREEEIKKTIVIEELNLVSFNYSRPAPKNMVAINTPVAGQILSAVSDDIGLPASTLVH